MYNRVLTDNTGKRLKLFVLALASALGASLTTCYFDHIRSLILHFTAT